MCYTHCCFWTYTVPSYSFFLCTLSWCTSISWLYLQLMTLISPFVISSTLRPYPAETRGPKCIPHGPLPGGCQGTSQELTSPSTILAEVKVAPGWGQGTLYDLLLTLSYYLHHSSSPTCPDDINHGNDPQSSGGIWLQPPQLDFREMLLLAVVVWEKIQLIVTNHKSQGRDSYAIHNDRISRHGYPIH